MVTGIGIGLKTGSDMGVKFKISGNGKHLLGMGRDGSIHCFPAHL